jgi:F-type H+-transporting ATPase subunit b
MATETSESGGGVIDHAAMGHGETQAMTEAHGGAVPHKSMFDPGNPEFWVYVGLTIFILLAIFVAKAPQKIAAALDGRIADTKRNLDEAAALRAEAEKLLSQAKAKVAASAGDAKAIIDHAETEAKNLIESAKVKAADLTVRRTKMAEDKIVSAERGAVADVRARAALLAASIATAAIGDSHDASADKNLVDSAIARLN